MNLEEFKKKIDEMYEKYGGEIDVMVCLTTDEGLDDTIFKKAHSRLSDTILRNGSKQMSQHRLGNL